jgi:hypothetical protein
MKKSMITSGIVTLGLCLLFGAAETAAGYTFGVRAGLGLQPDQFVIGAQSRLGQFLPAVRFAPGFDIGFGDDVTTFTANGDFLVTLGLPKSPTAFYFGGGPTLTVYDFTSGSETEIGVTAVGGLMLPMGSSNHYNLEARLGIGDVPDVRILFGLFL